MKFPLTLDSFNKMTPSNDVLIDLYHRQVAIVRDGTVEKRTLTKPQLEAVLLIVNDAFKPE